ncbi:ABC transporter permease [Periweissella cryptocerci]|uniref:ABC transporter permease n=1 Tax=Periweissella cryptocerci TaxID=2506420 RepID=A0A4P6YTT7_9LACO|nr:ABC transporter permease [Periweissella cryptocerci]QBO36077.1 ABC transporter permease [Periweissella cryptocerci]
MNLIVSAVGQGLLWAVLGLGLFLTFRILNFADMSVEGTFPLGAATAVALLHSGVNPYLAMLAAFGAGAVAGLVTGLLYTKGNIPILLAGILTMTATFSINLRIMNGSNLSLLNKHTILNSHFMNSLPPYFNGVLVGLIIITIITLLTMYFLQTEYGQAFIATGDNPDMARSFGINTDGMTIMGLMLSNGLIAFGGALIAQNNGYADVNMGIGIIVIALASIIIGEVAFGELTMNQRLIAIVVGSILYRFVLLIVMQLGFAANDLNLLSAVVLALALLTPKFRKIFGFTKVMKGSVKTHD